MKKTTETTATTNLPKVEEIVVAMTPVVPKCLTAGYPIIVQVLLPASLSPVLYTATFKLVRVLRIVGNVAQCTAEYNGILFRCFLHCGVEPYRGTSLKGISNRTVLTVLDPTQITVGKVYNFHSVNSGARALTTKREIFVVKILDRSESMVTACCYSEESKQYFLGHIVCNVK